MNKYGKNKSFSGMIVAWDGKDNTIIQSIGRWRHEWAIVDQIIRGNLIRGIFEDGCILPPLEHIHRLAVAFRLIRKKGFKINEAKLREIAEAEGIEYPLD